MGVNIFRQRKVGIRSICEQVLFTSALYGMNCYRIREIEEIK